MRFCFLSVNLCILQWRWCQFWFYGIDVVSVTYFPYTFIFTFSKQALRHTRDRLRKTPKATWAMFLFKSMLTWNWSCLISLASLHSIESLWSPTRGSKSSKSPAVSCGSLLSKTSQILVSITVSPKPDPSEHYKALDSMPCSPERIKQGVSGWDCASWPRINFSI